MAKNTLVIGCNGLLASCLANDSSSKEFRFVSHLEAKDDSIFDDVDCVVNLALHPDYMHKKAKPAIDFELEIGERIHDSHIHYVMMSTRKVYHSDRAMGGDELSPCGGVDQYGQNKLATEHRLSELLGDDRLTIIRLANILAFDRSPQRKNFVSSALLSLEKTGRIVYDVSPFTRRDFITEAAFARVMVRVVERKLGGTFNLGSGIALPIGNIALWFIQGFGQGELLVVSPEIRDEFYLNTAKTKKEFGLECSYDDLMDHCVVLGERLSHA